MFQYSIESAKGGLPAPTLTSCLNSLIKACVTTNECVIITANNHTSTKTIMSGPPLADWFGRKFIKREGELICANETALH